MSKNPGLKFDASVSIRKATGDGYIWLPARVIWLGHEKFKAEFSGGIHKTLSYAEQNETWRMG